MFQCRVYLRFRTRSRLRQERLKAGESLPLYRVSALRSTAFVRLCGGWYGNELRRNWEKTKQCYIFYFWQHFEYLPKGLTFFAHDRFRRCVIHHWSGHAGAAAWFLSDLILLQQEKKITIHEKHSSDSLQVFCGYNRKALTSESELSSSSSLGALSNLFLCDSGWLFLGLWVGDGPLARDNVLIANLRGPSGTSA